MTRRRPTWVERTEEAIDDRTAPAPGDRKYATGPSAASADRGALRHEQQDEVAQSWLGLGALTDAQFKGGLAGALVGGAIGALLFLPLGFVEWGGLALGWHAHRRDVRRPRRQHRSGRVPRRARARARG